MDCFPDPPDHLAIALAYIVKLPTANSATLGTGRVDQRFLIPVSALFHGLQVDAYVGADTDALPNGAIWGAEEAIGVTAGIGHSLSVHGGFSAQRIDTDQPAGSYLSGGLTWQLHRLAAIDLGARAGLSAGTPAFGLTAGVTTTLVTRERLAGGSRIVALGHQRFHLSGWSTLCGRPSLKGCRSRRSRRFGR